MNNTTTAKNPLKILFDGPVNSRTASGFELVVKDSLTREYDGLWVKIQCTAGDPSSAAMLFEFVRGLPVPTWGHVIGAVFSAGSTFYFGFARRTLAPTAKIGLHTATLTEPTRATADENWLMDQLAQVRGHNEQMIAQVRDATGCDQETAERWLRGCKFWIGNDAVNDGVAHAVERNVAEFLDGTHPMVVS